jgi:peptide/nickel transport system substrate-binding protein
MSEDVNNANPTQFSRRRFLKIAAITAAALPAGSALLAACGDNTPTPATSNATTAAATTSSSSTTTAAAAGTTAAAASGSGAAPAQLPRNQTLYVGGFQWQPPVNFNILNNNPDWPSQGGFMEIYEALFAYNQLSGNLDPLLAKSLATPDQTTMDITLQDGTKWQDGQPLTPDDVVYTYGLAKTQSDVSYSNLFDYISSITATGDRTLEIKLNPSSINPGFVKNFLTTIRILPKHIWQGKEASGKLSAVVDTAPVGSGPYKLLDFSPQRVALQRDDNYWGKSAMGGLPAPKYIVHPIVKSNDDGNLAFQNGQIDVMQQFTPQIWKMWQDAKAPVGTWFDAAPYYVAGSIPMLIINTQKKGLDNPLVRRALAYSINYPLIAQTAMSQYSVPANSSLIIPGGGENQFFNADSVKANGWSYDPAKAKDILENQLKAKKGSDGVYVLPDGTRLGPWSARTPTGWTDWQTAINVVVQNGKAAGFDLTEDYPDAGVVTTKIQSGDFDLNLWYIAGQSPATPWQRFRDMLDNRGVPANGQNAFWDYNRFSEPAALPLLDKAASASPSEAKQYYDQLDQLFMKDIPGIPLMYRPNEFYEFNSSVWSGFPTSKNSANGTPQFQQSGIFWLYKIKAKS